MKISYPSEGPGKNTTDLVLEESKWPNLQLHVEIAKLHYRRVAPDWHYPMHEHPYYEMNYVIAGSQKFQVADEEILLEAGEMMFFCPGEFHASSTEEELIYLSLHFTIDHTLFLPFHPQLDQRHFKRDGEVMKRVTPFLDSVYELAKENNVSALGSLTMYTQVVNMIHQFSEAYQLQPAFHENVSASSLRLAKLIVKEVENCVNEGNMRQLKVEDLSAMLGYTPSYCTKLFKIVFHVSLKQYLLTRIINEAKLLLAKQELTIEQIADAAGFYDASHFSRQFKKWTGLNPRAYQQLHQTYP